MIVAQMTYGFTTVHLTPPMLKRLDAIEVKGLLRVLKIELHANHEVYDEINIILNKETDLRTNTSLR